MGVALENSPTLFSNQYTEDVGKYRLYYNPTGHGEVVVVDQQSQKLLELCDGAHSVDEIIMLDGRESRIVVEELNYLANSEVISISEMFSQNLYRQTSNKRSKSFACWLHLTNTCNLACSYCYVHKSPGDMSVETGKLAIDKMIQTCQNNNIHSMNVKVAGGEPLMRFSLIKELVDYSKKNCGDIKITYTLLTNGVLVTQEIAEFLRQNSIGIGVSLDGIGAVNDMCRHDRYGNGSYDSVIKGLKILREFEVQPSIMTTVSSINHSGLLELTKYLLENKYYFRFSLEKDCDTGQPKILEDTDGVIKSLHSCYDYIEQNLPEKYITNIHKFGDVNFSRPAGSSCGAANNLIAIGHDRNLGVCGLGLSHPFSTLDLSNDLLEGAVNFNSDLVNNVASDNLICCDCTWRKSCAGGCPLQTKSTYGRYDKPSPFCEIYKAILPRILRIKAMQMIRNFESNYPC